MIGKVLDGQRHSAFVAESDGMRRFEILRPILFCFGIGGQSQCDFDRFGVELAHGFDVPIKGAGEPVHRGIGFGATIGEPGEADGDSAANGFAGFKKALGAHEEQRALAGLLITRDVSAVEVDLPLARVGLDSDARQAAFTGFELNDAGYSELFLRLVDGHVLASAVSVMRWV